MPRRRYTSRLYVLVSSAFLLVMVIALAPAQVDAVAYLTGHGAQATFVPLSYQEVCGKHHNCHVETQGMLRTAPPSSLMWHAQVPLNHDFQVRLPVWSWGFGGRIFQDASTAIGYLVAGLIIDVLAVAFGVLFVKPSRKARTIQPGRHESPY